MLVNDSILQRSEKTIFALRELFLSRGYRSYHMSKFEEYDFYARNKDFLISDNVITFTDTNGKLMALKPDVTLSLIKNTKDQEGSLQKFFYNENVYRVSRGTNAFKEIPQAGVEAFGDVSREEIACIIKLACDSLCLLSENYVLDISDIDILQDMLESLDIPADIRSRLYTAIGEKNCNQVEMLCVQAGVPADKASALKKAAAFKFAPDKAVKELSALSATFGNLASAAEFSDFLKLLTERGLTDRISVDLSVTGDMHYYNGIVFKGFINSVPNMVLSGGQYDRLMRKMQRSSKAIGFAIYLDVLDRLDPDSAKVSEETQFINVALPKGRLGEKVYDMFARSGFECPSILETNRKLIFENSEKKIRFFWVKPSDVAIYVERGAADIGVAGKDILLEYSPDVYEMLDLNVGKCRMAVAAPGGYTDDNSRALRVATKFSDIAKEFYRSKGRDIDIIELNGSIELAPILGLSDVIVDIVETGTTLRENNLEVVEEIIPISARLIANKAAYKFKNETIERIVRGLSEVVEA